jgi:hypothetical protein
MRSAFVWVREELKRETKQHPVLTRFFLIWIPLLMILKAVLEVMSHSK